MIDILKMFSKKKKLDFLNFDIIKTTTNTLEDSFIIEYNLEASSYIIEDIDNYYLVKNVQEKLELLFGDCNIHNEFDYYNKIWIVSYKNVIFNIFTSNNETNYEMVCKNIDIVRNSSVCFDFIRKIDYLLKHLN